MLLAVDIGNSTTKLGVFRDGELLDRWRVATVPHRSSDELALLVAGLLGLRRASAAPGDAAGSGPAGSAPAGSDLLRSDLTGVVVGSVVPPVTDTYREMAERYLAAPLLVLAPGVRTGIAVRHEHPQDLGADRIANAIAAGALYGGPAVVVDFGTATSFDVIDAAGAFIGGAIAPGVLTSTDAMVRRAARLPTVEIELPPSVIGRSTVAALQSGIVHGFAGQVDRIVARMIAEIGSGVTTVATGGLAPAILHACETIDHHDPWLTLKGLHLVWERNRD